MNLVTTLRELWRLRRSVAIIATVAILAGLFVLFRPGLPPQSRQYAVGVSTAQILVDTPSSQVVDVSPKGSDLLGLQANLLASLMVDGTIRADIAQRAGIPASKLVGVTSAVTEPSATGPAPVSAPSGANAYVLNTQILTDAAGDNLPIIQLSAQAPTAAAANRLANAAIAGLSAYVSTRAAAERIPDSDRLQITGLNATPGTTDDRGPTGTVAAIIMFVVFFLGCCFLLGGQGLVRAWRAAAASERQDALEAENPAPAPAPREDAAVSLVTPLESHDGDVAFPAVTDTESDVTMWLDARAELFGSR